MPYIEDLQDVSKKDGGYLQLEDDKTYEFDPEKIFICLACCDCGLVHDITFKVLENGRIRFKVIANFSKTNKIRNEKSCYIQQNVVPGWKIIKKDNYEQ